MILKALKEKSKEFQLINSIFGNYLNNKIQLSNKLFYEDIQN